MAFAYGFVKSAKLLLTTGKMAAFTRTKRSPSQPDWSPDGEKIAHIDNPAHPGIDYELFVINADGSGPRQLTDSTGYQTYAGPDWSPDGSRLSVASDQNGNYDIFLILNFAPYQPNK